MLIQDYMLNMDTQLWFAKNSAELKQVFTLNHESANNVVYFSITVLVGILLSI